MASISVDDFADAVANILRGYGDLVYQATEEGLTAAEKLLINNLRATSPRDTPDYYKKWKGKKKYKLKRYIGNTKTVKGEKSDTIPLSNILEYSENSPHQGLIKKTYENSAEEMAQAVVNEIKKI